MNPTVPTEGNFACHFEKKGPIRFISHLDLSRAFHRAFIRADLNLKFSEGFSPHPKFSLGLPLSVGTESEAEFAFFTLKDASLSPETVKDRLQAQMPAGVKILDVRPTSEKGSVIALASYRILLPRAGEKKAEVESLFASPVTVMKKNKKGKLVEKELSGGIHCLTVTQTAEGLVMEARLAADGENFLKPELLLTAMEAQIEGIDLTGVRILRRDVFRADGSSLKLGR